MVTKIEERPDVIEKPRFRDPRGMTEEQLTGPDYRLKQLLKQNGANPLTCSKCHHCR